MFGMVLEFESPVDKEVFLNNSPLPASNTTDFKIFAASLLLNETFAKYDIHGNIHIVAFQLGGD